MSLWLLLVHDELDTLFNKKERSKVRRFVANVLVIDVKGKMVSCNAVEGGHILLTSQNGGQYFGWEIVMTIKITFKI